MTNSNVSAGENLTIPPEVLQIPAMQAILAGSPPAVGDKIKTFESRPEAATLSQARKTLAKAGTGFYKSADGTTGVIFNRFYVSPQELVQADKAGSLSKLAPPWDEVTKSILSAGPNHPALANPTTPAGFKSDAAPVSPGVAIAPSKVPDPVATARMQVLKAGAPSSGSVPGAGRLVNSILKPVV
jgi:hypothetical protein